MCSLLFFVHHKVFFICGVVVLVLLFIATLEHRHDAGENVIEVRRLLSGSRDDQRCAGFIDKVGVTLIDDRKPVAAVLNNLVAGWGHIVAEVVKAELGAGCVDDVA